MLRRNIVIALRNIIRQRVFSLINIFGLAIGISASVIIYLLVQYDFSFDKFHKDGDRIYRVVSDFSYAGENFYNSGVTFPLAKEIDNKLPGVELAAPFYTMNSDLRVTPRSANQAAFKNQDNAIYADGRYFRMFNYKWLQGRPNYALSEPYQCVLTEERAALYFPGVKPEQVVGRHLVLNDTVLTTITGIIEAFDQHSDLSFSLFVSLPTLERWEGYNGGELTNWENTNSASQLFIKLSANATVPQVEKRLATVFHLHSLPGEDGKKKVSPFHLQQLGDIHFNDKYGTYFDNRMANTTVLYGLLAIAAFILVLACINFINLSTAQASQRAKEIGIRKTIGGGKKQLIAQMLTETFVLTFLSTVLSIALMPLVLAAMKDFVPHAVREHPFSDRGIWIFLPLLMAMVTLLAGLYPAFVISRYSPVVILQNRYVASQASSGLLVRKILTVTQFVIAQVFIVAVIIAGMQLHYSLTKDPGFRSKAIIHFQTDFYDTVGAKKFVLRDRIASLPGVQMVSLSTNPPAATGVWSSTIQHKSSHGNIETHAQVKMVDTNYAGLFGLRIIAGKNIRETKEVTEVLINETYAKRIDPVAPHTVVGKQLLFNNRWVPIVGVFADFHQQSLHEPIRPLVLGSQPINHRTVNVALAGKDPDRSIAGIEKAFKDFYPKMDFEYRFQDETIKNYYQQEARTAYLLKCATGVTIVISCLGLLGLTIFTTRRRVKEIGIRKVLGASVAQIVKLLARDFLPLVVIGFIIATPLAYLAADKWLANFAYRISVSWWIFGITFFAQLIVSMLTVGIQTSRSALANPVESLKSE